MCKRPDLSEDLTQETFLKALLSLSNHHTNMRAWLYLVARNTYFNDQKKDQRLVSWDGLQFQKDLNNSDFLSTIIKSEEKELLFLALQSLSANKRDVLQLQYFGDLSQGEIATILGLTPANVRVLALRAKRELKQFMEVKGYDIS